MTTARRTVITEADVNLLLREAAVIRSSYLGGDAEVPPDDAECERMCRDADRFDDLAAFLAPLCVPPLAELEQECSDCEGGRAYGGVCRACRGTALWPPTKDGARLRLIADA